MRHLYRILGLAALLAMVGCGKQPQSASEPAKSPKSASEMPTLASPSTAAAPALPPDAPPTAQAPAQPADVKPDPSMSQVPPGFGGADALNMVIANFYSEHGRQPRDLNELVIMKAIPRLPEAPAGKKFVLEGGRVKVVPR